MRRYLCVALLFLALDRLRRTHMLPRAAPIATFVRRSGGRRLTTVSPAAERLGVRRGMTVSAAKARAPALSVWEDDAAADRRVLERLGAWATRFTPTIGLLHVPDAQAGIRGRGTAEEVMLPALVLEIGGSASLFGGEEALVREALASLKRNRVTARGAVASTVGAAYALATTARSDELPILPRGEERRALSPLPLASLRLPEGAYGKLASLGLHDVTALCALPRSALAERFGPLVPLRLAQALGEVEEPLDLLRIESSFTRRVELPAPTEHAHTIAHVIEHLCDEASRWLLARGLGARELTLTLTSEDEPPMRLVIGLATPRRGRGPLLRLLRERLARTVGPARIAAVELALVQTTPVADRQQRLLYDPDADDDDDGGTDGLVGRLAARLGEERVLRAELLPDPRPERAYRLFHATRPRRRSAPRRPRGPHAEVAIEPRARSPTPGERPLVLVEPPERLAAGGAQPVRGPERVACGWWEGDGVPRDFFTAKTPDGRLLWVERTGEGWLIHGRFT